MAEVLAFQHVLGHTPGFDALLDRLREAGHTVHAADLFDGRTFASIQEGVAHVQEVGFGTVLDRGVATADGLPDGLVLLGVSLGVMPAQKLAQTRPGTRGAVFLEACLPVDEFGDGWPAGVPVQVHGMDADPFFAEDGDIDAARALVADADDAELFTYPGDTHLFTDSSLPSHDADATDLVVERVLALLDRV